MSDIKKGDHEELFHRLEDTLNKIKFGSVTLVIQDGKVIQIETHEKTRIN